MDARQHVQVVSFIWNTADNVLGGSLNRTTYRVVILPMTVIRWLNFLLQPTTDKGFETWQLAGELGIGEQHPGLFGIARLPFRYISGLLDEFLVVVEPASAMESC